ncbi:hypothetical protein BCV69DRAFT_283977 [Microstroma glucosiphilum]|uniref:Uncharacterized protein n=1 Tax=Pseudomicrostroma glucosiphilum TaxID=1684307 RepID=A0A316U4X2_9BASI|nr:hypothetical protein BCV69DRAFT_283977 [Pseudomicrostroma glucosiphilum]PWN19874.1 hypothetical protein BCV69DRAFT_283977 [Pseudomicrostroma glucosiphilum]
MVSSVTPPPRTTSSPSPSFPSSPSSRAPSMIDDPTFSDVSSLDDEDYELIDGQTPSAIYDSTNLSASQSWMGDSVQSTSPHTGHASIAAPSMEIDTTVASSRDRRGSPETLMDHSWAASEDQQHSLARNQSAADQDIDTPVSSTHHLAHAGLTTGALPSDMAAGTNAGGSGGSTVSTWILPDPTSPENSIHLGHSQQCSTPNATHSKSASDQHSRLEAAKGLPAVDPVWKRTLGASWERTLDSDLSSSEPQLSHGVRNLSDTGGHNQNDIPAGEKHAGAIETSLKEPIEPDWAQKTRAWLQISSSGTVNVPEEFTGARRGGAASKHQDSQKADCNLRGLVEKGSHAARAHMKIAIPNNASQGLLLHWLVAALCGFVGAVVLLHPALPTEAIRAAMSFSTISPFASFISVQGDLSPASLKSAEMSSVSMQKPQPLETAAISALSLPSSFDLLVVNNDHRKPSQHGRASSISSSMDEDKEVAFTSASQDLGQGNAPISEWLLATSQAVWRTLKTNGAMGVAAAYAEWYYWETRLKALWFEVMEPMVKQVRRDLEAIVSTLGTELWDATSFASAYGQAMSTSATKKAHRVLKHSEAAHKATLKQAEAFYEAYLKDQLSENKQRASEHFEKARKTAQHLQSTGGEHATQFYQSAKGCLETWSREAAKVAGAGKETWSDFTVSSEVSSRARRVVSNAEKGKKAILEAIEARHRAVAGARGLPSDRSGPSIRSRAARKATTKRGKVRGQSDNSSAYVVHSDFLSEAAAPLQKASQQARDAVQAQLKRASKGSDAAKKSLQKGLSSFDEQWKRATKKAKVGTTKRSNKRVGGSVKRRGWA